MQPRVSVCMGHSMHESACVCDSICVRLCVCVSSDGGSGREDTIRRNGSRQQAPQGSPVRSPLPLCRFTHLLKGQLIVQDLQATPQHHKHKLRQLGAVVGPHQCRNVCVQRAVHVGCTRLADGSGQRRGGVGPNEGTVWWWTIICGRCRADECRQASHKQTTGAGVQVG